MKLRTFAISTVVIFTFIGQAHSKSNPETDHSYSKPKSYIVPYQEPSVYDLRDNPDPFTEMCVNKFGQVTEKMMNRARQVGFVDTFANALAAAIDEGDLVLKNRCFQSISWFNSFLKGENGLPGYFSQNYTKALFRGEDPYPIVTIIDPAGSKSSVQVNCTKVLETKHPKMMDFSEKVYAETAKALLQQPLELKAMLNRTLGPGGRMHAVNGPKAIIQEVVKDSSDSECLIVKAYSAKEAGGYGYGRNFHFCSDAKKVRCGSYYGEGVDKLLELNEAQHQKEMKDRKKKKGIDEKPEVVR